MGNFDNVNIEHDVTLSDHNINININSYHLPTLYHQTNTMQPVDFKNTAFGEFILIIYLLVAADFLCERAIIPNQLLLVCSWRVSKKQKFRMCLLIERQCRNKSLFDTWSVETKMGIRRSKHQRKPPLRWISFVGPKHLVGYAWKIRCVKTDARWIRWGWANGLPKLFWSTTITQIKRALTCEIRWSRTWTHYALGTVENMTFRQTKL